MYTGSYEVGTTSDIFRDWSAILPDGMTEADEIKELAAIGFNALDYGIFLHQSKNGKYWGDDWADYAKNLAEAAKESGIRFSQLHAPMFNMRGENADEQFMLTKRSFEIAQIMGAPYVVVHPQFWGECIYGANHESTLKYNLEFYRSLLDISAKTGVKIALENMFGYDPEKKVLCPTYFSYAEDILELLDCTEGREQFGICLDIGHANIIGKDSPADYIRKYGSDLKILHIHDNNGDKDDHMPPYFGSIDWADTVHALREVDYTGVLSLEAQSMAHNMPQDASIRRTAAILAYQLVKKIASLK